MNLNQLKLFHTIASEGSLTKAAKKLYISQPGVSSQLKKFESELDVKLFDKKGNKNVLNENGQLLYGYTQKIFKLIAEAENDLQDHSKLVMGNVHIGGGNTAGTYILPKIIGAFKKKYPDVNINLHVSDTSEIAAMVSENQLDFAINGGTVPKTANVEEQLLFYDELILCVSPTSDLAKKNTLNVRELLHEAFVMHDPHSQLYQYTEKIFSKLNMKYTVSMFLGNIEAMKQAVEAELGIAFIPKTAVAYELKTGILKEVTFPNHKFYYPQSLMYCHGRYMNPAAKILMKMVQESLLNE